MPTTNTAHLDLDRIDLRILRLVLILSNTQSLTKTAAAMKLSVSQASRLLADARAIFGTEIFSRHGPQMVPSPQLLELLPRLQNVFKALDSLLGGASTLNILESSEVIRIAAVDNTAMVFIMPFLKELHQRAPKLGIEIVPLGNQSAAGLESGAVDFMYACDPHLPADPSLRQRLLLAAPHCVLVRKDHPLCEVPDGIVGPEELARYPMVIPTVSQPSGLNAMIMPFQEISSQRFLQSPFFLANAWSLLDSDGYTIHPIPLAEILTERLPLAALKPKDIVIPPWVPHLYWSVRTDADPLRQWVRSFLISCARQRWSRYCSDDEAGWREAMASLEAASICSVCSEEGEHAISKKYAVHKGTALPFADQQRLSKHESRCCKPCVSIAGIRQFLHFVWFSKL